MPFMSPFYLSVFR